ncbi:MAG: hypothetical protein NTV14_01550 [Coprothermobacterota bacterium]|nr:hypothetical protein [Coprothermobacterota bacterium]
MSAVVQARFPWPLVAAVVVGLVSWLIDFRLLTGLELNVPPLVDYLVFRVTGARGSNWLHDMLAWFQTLKEKARTSETTIEGKYTEGKL